MVKSTYRRRSFIVPLDEVVEYYLYNLEQYNWDAPYAYSTREIMEKLIHDALQCDTLYVIEPYATYIEALECADVDKFDAVILLATTFRDIRTTLHDYGVPLGTRFMFDWYGNHWDIIIKEEL